MQTGSPVRVGDFRAYFRVASSEGGGQWLDRLTQEPSGPWSHPWPEGAQVSVHVTVVEANGELFAGEVSVSTAPQPIDLRPALDIVIPAPVVDPLPVGTDIWRMVRIGKLCREAVQNMFTEDAYWGASAELAEDPEAFERLADATNSHAKDGERRRPGRPSAVTPEFMAAAVRAYRNAGGSVQAAREVLQEAGLPGSGPDGEVTRDQAKKVIATARERGLLPRAHKDRRGTTNVASDN